MTHKHTPPPAAHLRPFAHNPSRWKAEQSRALRTGHVCRHLASTQACEPVFIRERTGWGWLEWTVPGDGSLPERPHRIGVLTPTATHTQRLALRWLTRRPAQRLALPSLRTTTAVVAILSLTAAGLLLSHGVSAGATLAMAVVAPVLAEQVPKRWDARARQHVRSVEGKAACQCLQRLAAWHTFLVQAAADSDHYEVRRSAEVGRRLLWEAAGLLTHHDTRTASSALIARERLLIQLADQVARKLSPAPPPQDGTTAAHHRSQRRPLGPYPPRPTTAAGPAPYSSPSSPRTAPMKGPHPMTEHHPGEIRTEDVYLLFAHEPYYPAPGQEINTSLVAATTLLHPGVRQPDGARIHDLLTHGRRPGEIVPLATLTHELDGGADWPKIGDWERVTGDLLRLIRQSGCDALSLGLPAIARALICNGPDTELRAYDATADRYIPYGRASRTAVLDQLADHLDRAVSPHGLWPGDGLLPPLSQRT
ncbi:hypothetical protein ABZ612_31295 [Streptomyces avermitilis]|uniref:hypothetical protein n=1 Tax=Streptomyces avermitilis TaxID=33903 RepID=UPI0033CDA7E5